MVNRFAISKYGRLVAMTALMFSALAMGSVPAQAQQITAANPGGIVHFLQALGHKVEVSADSSEDPMLTVKTDDHTYRVFFYGCTDGKNCDSIQFYAGWTEADNNTMKAMNDWNKEHRYGRAYIDNDGDPCIEFDIETGAGGISPGLFADEVEVWGLLMDAFTSYVYN